MKRFVEGVDRGQSTLFPECLDDWIDEDNPVRVIDVFVEELDLGALDFGGVDPKATGRPSYHPPILLKLYVYGYLNRRQSSRRLERDAGRNVEVMSADAILAAIHVGDKRYNRSTLMSAFTSSRQVNPWLSFKRVFRAALGRAGGAAVMTTVDHTLMRGLEPHHR
jgi:hypothetical protein